MPETPDSNSIGRAGAGAILALLVTVYLGLATWGNSWGTPSKWHPDEKQFVAQSMVLKRTVNPEHFAYGGMPYYMLAVGAVLPAYAYAAVFDPWPGSGGADEGWRERHDTRVTIFARAFVAALGAGVVVITYLMGACLFGRATGLLAAAFLAVSPYFVALGHFAIVDMPGNFWYWLAMLLSLQAWRDGGPRWYAASALALGFATGVKIDRIMGAFALLAAHWLRGDGLRIGGVIRLALFGLLGYLLANLTVFTAFFSFLEGTVRDLFFGLSRGSEGQVSFAAILRDFAEGMGWPLLAAGLAGVALLLAGALTGHRRGAAVWLLMTVLPSYLLFGSRLSAPWYAPFYFPAITVAAAYFCVEGIRRSRPALRTVFSLTAVAIVGWATLKSVVFDLQLVNDPRYAAAAWIEANVPDGASVEVGLRNPMLDGTRIDVAVRKRDPRTIQAFLEWQERMNANPTFQTLNRALLDFEEAVRQRLDLAPRQAYAAWFDKFNLAEEVAERSTADYQVFIGSEQPLIDALLLPDSGYEVAGRFEPVSPLGTQTQFPFVNPEVWIFRRDGFQPQIRTEPAQPR